MQLPSDLQHFPHLALIVLSDNGSSKLFLVGGESLEQLDGVSDPVEPLPDHEGSFEPGSHGVETDRFKHYAKMLAQHVTETVTAHNVTYIHLVMPPHIEHMVSADLPTTVKAKVMQGLHLDLMNEAPLDVVRRLLQD